MEHYNKLRAGTSLLHNISEDNTMDTAKDTALNDIAKAKGYEITEFI